MEFGLPQYEEADKKLKELNDVIRSYSVGLLPLDEEGHRIGLGSGVFISASNKYAILTAGHVAKKIENSAKLGLCFGTGGVVLQKYSLPLESLKIKILGKDPKQGPDIALIFLPDSTASTIKAKALFYSIEKATTINVEKISTYPLVCMGCLGHEIERKSDHEVIPLMGMGVVADSLKERDGFDYITCIVSVNPIGVRLGLEKAIQNYQGLSGAPLWNFENGRPVLIGIAYAQDMEPVAAGGSEGTLSFHGPKSLYQAALALFAE